MATFTTILSLRKPAGTDFVNRTLDLNNNWDSIDALFHGTTGHKHTGATTNAPRLLVEQNFEVNREIVEASTLDTLDASSRLINNLNRIRFWITQVSGQALGTVSVSLNSHVTAVLPAHGISGFAAPVTISTANAAGAATNVPRSDHVHAHGSLAAITNAHAFADMSGVITDAQHGARTVASAHGMAQITGTISTTQHGALAAITNAHAFADISGIITDAQHGTRTVASAHGMAQISGTISTTQHGALAAITNAHAFTDISGVVTDTQHGVRTLANAHGFGQISGTITTTQHTAMGALANSHPYASITGLEFHAARHAAGGADPVVSGAMIKIAEVVLGSAQATISFTSIPATYKHLRILMFGRVDSGSGAIEINVQFNGDAGSNHDYVTSLMSTTGGGNGTVVIGNVLGAGACTVATMCSDFAPSGAADSSVFDIAGYAQTTFQKAILAFSQQKRANSNANILMGPRVGWWRSTAAINRVDFIPTAGNFKIGTIISVYGVT